MKITTISGSDLKVSQVCLGSTSIGTRIDRETSFALLDRFVERGGNFVDTARVYAAWLPDGEGASEQTIGDWLQSRGLRDQIVLATKGAHPPLEAMHTSRLSAAEIESDVEDSLRALQTEVIDLYWLHRDHVSVPVDSIIDSMNALVKAGKIRYFGCSNWTVDRIEAANHYARSNGLAGFVANQPLWSLAAVKPESIKDKTLVIMDEAILDYHRETDLACIPYSSQGKGYFTKLAEDRLKDSDINSYDSPQNRARYARVRELAGKYGVSVTAITLAYLTSQPFPVAAIIGPRIVAQLDDSLTDSDLTLSLDELAYLEQVG